MEKLESRVAVAEPGETITTHGASGFGTLPAVSLITPAQATTRPRMKQLDVLRAIAVLLVLCSHVRSVNWLQRFGWIGVDLFFVLSGFLVSGLLFSEYTKQGSLSPKRFLIRRGLKIYPAFYTFVILSVILMVFTKMKIAADLLLAEIFFVQNYYGGLWGHTWSLCVEEHFYLLLTAGLYLLWRRRSGNGLPFDAIPKLTLIVAAVLIGARALTYFLVVPYNFQYHLKPTHLCLDSLLFGVCLAYFYHFHHNKLASFVSRTRWWLLLFSAAAIAPAVFLPVSSAFVSIIGFPLLYLGFGSVLLLALHSTNTGWYLASASGSVLARIGAYSYSIYLWHLVVASLGLTLIRRAYSQVHATLSEGLVAQPLNPLVEFAAYVVASIAVGIVMAKLVEMPVLRLRDRYFPGRS